MRIKGSLEPKTSGWDLWGSGGPCVIKKRENATTSGHIFIDVSLINEKDHFPEYRKVFILMISRASEISNPCFWPP